MMDKDKAIRAAKLTVKGMDKTSENIADYVAELLRQGRASEVTDDLMAQADPQRLMHHYKSGNTGADMPMDYASRMGRAGQMGFDTGNKLYHGGVRDFSSFIPSQSGKVGPGVYMTPNERKANIFSGYEPDSNPKIEKLLNEGNEKSSQVYGLFATNRPATMEARQAVRTNESAYDDKAENYRKKFDEMGFDGVSVADERTILDPTNIRSQFARFDPRLSHLSHLSASTGGAMELARAVVAKNRAGGQIAPSKYLPGVPRAVHADGGAANAPMFQGVHESLQNESGAPLDLYHGTTQSKEFEAFDNAKLGARDAGFYGRGHYLTPLRGNAEGYADPDEMGRGAVIGPLHAALKNPYVWDISSDTKSNSTLRDLQSMGIMREKNELNPWDNLQQHHIQPFMAEMQKRGHDGVVVKTGHEHLPNGISEVVAFDPKTIKHTEAEAFDPSDPRIRRDDGGRVSYGNGGKSLGLYSKAAQIIRNQPQAKGNVDQLLAMVSKAKGVKPAELANAGRPAGDTMSKEELAKHFDDALPKVDVERIGGRDSNGFPQYEDYTLPGGENYREHLLHLSDEREPPKPIHRVTGAFPRDFDSEEDARQYIRRLDAMRSTPGMESIAESLTRYPAIYRREDGRSTDPNDFKSSHWGTPNVLAHVRMDDRDNGKTLHVQEVQSDWGQEGRDKGFHDPEKPFEVVNKKTKEVVSRHPDYSSMWDAYRTHPDSDNLNYGDVRDEKPPQGPYVGNTQQWTDLALKHVLTEAAKGGHDRVVFSPGEANADLYGQRKEVGTLKFLKSKDSGEAGIVSAYSKDGRRSSEHEVGSHDELAKLIGKENAGNLLAQPPTAEPDNGEDVYAHRLQGPLQVGGHGMVDYYKNYVHAGALKLLQQHDPSIKPENYDLPEGYKGFGLPMTETSRQSILKNGFQAFQRGGRIGKDYGGAMGYVPQFQTSNAPRLAVAKPPVQSQQQNSFAMEMLGSLLGNSQEAQVTNPTPSAASEGHAGVSGSAQAAMDALRKGWGGQSFDVVSDYRDPDKNQAVGGAKGSQHLHGNAFDIDTHGWTPEDKLALATNAYNAGFRGFGFYDNNMHFDVGGQRAWGPSYHNDSIPDWAQDWTKQYINRADGGRIGYGYGGMPEQNGEMNVGTETGTAPLDPATRTQAGEFPQS